jgi:ubiquinone/menaquinone biosynthesis C-methylase UbiE
MGKEIDLLVNYPKTQRDVTERGNTKSDADRDIARRFDREFFDGDRRHGYGGFNYVPRFWQPVIPTLREHFKLAAGTSLLDIGCAKGFMLHDLRQLIPGIQVAGVDISDYAIDNSLASVREYLRVANATKLPFPDRSFDVVLSINTIHNLEPQACAQALREIQRVSRGKAFVTVDAYRTNEEKERMFAWNLTAKTIMSVEEWVAFFAAANYTGDYFWFIP